MVDARVVHSFKLRCFCVSFSVNRLFSEALLKCALLPPGTTHSYVLCSENHLVDHIQCDKWQDRTPPLTLRQWAHMVCVPVTQLASYLKWDAAGKAMG